MEENKLSIKTKIVAETIKIIGVLISIFGIVVTLYFAWAASIETGYIIWPYVLLFIFIFISVGALIFLLGVKILNKRRWAWWLSLIIISILLLICLKFDKEINPFNALHEALTYDSILEISFNLFLPLSLILINILLFISIVFLIFDRKKFFEIAS